MNLEQICHYVDESTLRFHGSRILESYVSERGFLFGLIESKKRGFNPADGRCFSFQIFNLAGRALVCHSQEYPTQAIRGFSTKKKAKKEFFELFERLEEREIEEAREAMLEATKCFDRTKANLQEMIGRAAAKGSQK